MITKYPTSSPTTLPTYSPTTKPSLPPTNSPTTKPTQNPTSRPTVKPTLSPTSSPTINPTFSPTFKPTQIPTAKPTTVTSFFQSTCSQSPFCTGNYTESGWSVASMGFNYYLIVKQICGSGMYCGLTPTATPTNLPTVSDPIDADPNV
eukprot:CAMPEP_0196764242 /NCGR_PEP_ID=MMETSP1095-20130614/5709_1 /TAXON_ID=96789 ORGANISM="Chromulina nebulosa, Strain UTEXLB2642" /NCGR_SAMPLE_ID=MMETSP1095 /ASSEMBLY_ACC=CAM_ASM_000446 /LENGTH=147 /DNA_ID=CAMNT_0042119305 /DNA_START=142 /DNA_END=585 /DNA_ORIENTATION=-